jgi:hypothetical protein
MTDREEAHINARFDKLDSAIEEIRRGLYGDLTNKVPGLVVERIKDHERIVKLEETKKKAIWWGAGAIFAIEMTWHYLKDKIGI